MEATHAGSAAAAPPGRRPAAPDTVDVAFDEFCKLREAGRDVDPEEFCSRYPARQHSLRDLIEAHLFINANPDLLAVTGVHWPRAGEHSLKWVLEEEIAEGGFAHVFLARQPALGDRRVVLKL